MSQKKIEEALNKILNKKVEEPIVEETKLEVSEEISIDGFDIAPGKKITVGGVAGTIQKIGGDVVFINSDEGGTVLEVDIPTVLAALRAVSESTEVFPSDELKNISNSGAEYFNSKHGTSFSPHDVEQYLTQPNSQGESKINAHLNTLPDVDQTHPEFGNTHFGIPGDKFRKIVDHNTIFESKEEKGEKEEADEVADEPAVKIDNPIDPDLENDDVDGQGQTDGKKVEESTLDESSYVIDGTEEAKDTIQHGDWTIHHLCKPGHSGASIVARKEGEKSVNLYTGNRDGADRLMNHPSHLKKMVDISNGNFSESTETMDALFQGDTLTEELKLKLETIFKAALAEATETKVATEIARLNEEYTSKEKALVEKLELASDEDTQKLTEKIDEYFDVLSEQWMKDNELALEARIKSELTEQFINELQGVFARNYIDLPVEKFDVVNDLQEKLIQAENKLVSLEESNKSITESFAIVKREQILDETTKGMTELDSGKFRTMMEEFEFESEDQFKRRSDIVKESFFGGKKTSTLSEKKEIKIDVSGKALNEEVEVKENKTDAVSSYASYITKTVKKQY